MWHASRFPGLPLIVLNIHKRLVTKTWGNTDDLFLRIIGIICDGVA